MLKTLNMERTCCPVGFSVKIGAVFQMKKKAQIDTDNVKKKFSFFEDFMQFLVMF